MAKSEKPRGDRGHRPEVSALLQAGQMPKALSPANLPDIDVTPAIEAARMIAGVAAVPRPKAPGYPAAGGNKSAMGPKKE
jgi:hypothetical protein